MTDRRLALAAGALAVLLCLVASPISGQTQGDHRIANLVDRITQVRARNALVRIGEPAVPTVSEALSSPRVDVRRSAARGLQEIGPAAAPAVEALARALRDADGSVRWWAAEALLEIGEASAPAVPALIEALLDPVDEVRMAAAGALQSVGVAALPAIPTLISRLDDPSREAREAAWYALSSLNPSDGSYIPTYLVELHARGAPEQTTACLVFLLGEMRGKAVAAVPALVALLSHPSELVRAWTSYALRRIGTDLKAKGTVLWWVAPRVYWKEIVGLLVALGTWFAFMARFPKQRRTSTPKHLTLMAFTATVPVLAACSAVYYAITQEWAQGFLPDTLTLVPFPVAAVLSTALACALPAVWVCQRKNAETSRRSAGHEIGDREFLPQ